MLAIMDQVVTSAQELDLYGCSASPLQGRLVAYEATDAVSLVQKGAPAIQKGQECRPNKVKGKPKPQPAKRGPRKEPKAKAKIKGPGQTTMPAVVTPLRESEPLHGPQLDVVPAARLLRAQRQGMRLCDLVCAAPPSLRNHIDQEMATTLIRRLREHLRQALLLGHVLRPLPAAPLPLHHLAAVDRHFADTLVSTNVGIVQEMLTTGIGIHQPDVCWPRSETQLMSQAPELRQLATWILKLGEDEECATASGSEGSESDQAEAPTESHPGSMASTGADAHATARPAPEATHGGLKVEPKADFDNEEVLTIALDEKDDDQDADDHAMVQTTMTLGSDSDEDVVLETRPDNIIPEADEDALFARVHDTLAQLWDQGHECVVHAIAAQLYQLGSQIKPTPEFAQVYFNMAQMVRPYLTTLGIGQGDPAPLWQAWTDGVTQDLSALCRRERTRAVVDRNRNNHGVAWTHPNANMNPPPDEDSEEVNLMAKAGQKKPNRPGPQRRHKNKLREQASRDKVASNVWVGPDRMQARALPNTRWLRNVLSWRHSAPNLRRRGRASKRPAATAACLDAAPTQRTTATLATSSGSLTPTVSGPPRAPAGDREAAPYDNEVGDANASSVPAHTTNFWRAHLGISLPSSADADEEAGDEGLLPTQRSALYAALAELRPRARIRMFAGLHMFLAALVQDVALVMDAVSDRDGRAEQMADEDTAEDGESQALEVDDEAALMQMTTADPRYSAFTMMLESVNYALQDLPIAQQFVVAQDMLTFLGAYTDLSSDVQLVIALFQAFVPPNQPVGPAQVPRGDQARRWLETWQPILVKHLGLPQPRLPLDMLLPYQKVYL